MTETALYIDGSLDPKTKVGFSAYLLVQIKDLQTVANAALFEHTQKHIRVQKFVNSSSSRLELEGLLWVLKHELIAAQSLTVYTDSQSIIGLPARRARLEQRGFKSRSTAKELSNAALYREFFSIYDALKFELIKLKGHTRAADRNRSQIIFACVDQCSRKALREHMHSG